MLDETTTVAAPAAEDDLRVLLDRARHGDRDSLPALRAALDRRPGVWRAYGDLAAHARAAWIELASGPDLALRESLGRQVEAIRGEAAGPCPTPLESLLAGRVAACWLQTHHADAVAARVGDAAVAQAEHARRRQDSAHRRYLSAIAALAMVRRLLARAPGPPSVAPPADPRTGLRVAIHGQESVEASRGQGRYAWDDQAPASPVPIAVRRGGRGQSGDGADR